MKKQLRLRGARGRPGDHRRRLRVAPAPRSTGSPAAPRQPAHRRVPRRSRPREAAAALSGELTLWHSYGSGGGETGALNEVLDAVRAANPDLRSTSSSSRSTDIFNKWRTDVAAGGGAGHVHRPERQPGPGRPRGVARGPRRVLAGNPALEGYLPVAVDGSKVDGKFYMVPESLKAVALWYDKRTIADAAGRPRTSSSPASRTARSSSASTRASTTSSAGPAPSAASSWTTPASASPTRAASPRRSPTSSRSRTPARCSTPTATPSSRLPDRRDQRDHRRPVADRGLPDRARRQPRRRADPGRPGRPGQPASPAPTAGTSTRTSSADQAELAVDVALALTAPERADLRRRRRPRPGRHDGDDHRPDHPGLRRRRGQPACPARRTPQFSNCWGQFGDALNKVIDTGADPATAVADACAADERGERPLAPLDHRTGAPTGRPDRPDTARRSSIGPEPRTGDSNRSATRHGGEPRWRPRSRAAAAPAVPASGGIQPYLYLVPAFVGDGDHHVLPAGLPGLDVVPRTSARRTSGSATPSRPSSSASTTTSGSRRPSSRSRTSSSCGSCCSTCGGRSATSSSTSSSACSSRCS